MEPEAVPEPRTGHIRWESPPRMQLPVKSRRKRPYTFRLIKYRSDTVDRSLTGLLVCAGFVCRRFPRRVVQRETSRGIRSERITAHLEVALKSELPPGSPPLNRNAQNRPA